MTKCPHCGGELPAEIVTPRHDMFAMARQLERESAALESLVDAERMAQSDENFAPSPAYSAERFEQLLDDEAKGGGS